MPHPLAILSEEETNIAREVVLAAHPSTVIDFREIYLWEPPKDQLQEFLALEHAGRLSPTTPRPPRQALCQYDVIGGDRIPSYEESVVDVGSRRRTHHEVVAKQHHAALTLNEFDVLVEKCFASPLFQQALSDFDLPAGFEVVIEPWPYGGRDHADPNRRFFQGLCFARDTTKNNPDANFYSFPLPVIPVIDALTSEIIRVDRPATGGKGEALDAQTFSRDIIGHCKSSDYVPELLPQGTRKDLKPLNVVQPDGPSFRVTDESLVEWQKWRFRVAFNPREGATIHDVWYDGRSVMYRLAISEMTVPYADPRPPFHRKQAFDFGDGGGGNMANNLSIGCDCLGVIKYFDAMATGPDGRPQKLPNAICLHEQDGGIGWKHSNWRTGRAVVTRNRELVVQFIITLANYEYVFAYKFDQAGGITVEARATGILNVVNIDANKTSDYGTVVSGGVLAQNHQHLFCVRMDPAIDGARNSVHIEESHPVPLNPATNPHGNLYRVQSTPVPRAAALDAAPHLNRVVKMINPHKRNPISQNPVAYKFTPLATQTLLADPRSIQAQRAQFAQHHVWVTGYRDHEFYAGGRYTLQSQVEADGVADAVKRGDVVEDADVVVWSCFGITHNPRVEDWPVMPVETFQLSIRPSDFFTENPALDVPSDRNGSSVVVGGGGGGSCCKPAHL
ncbi:putative copper amine oxidase [Aspergillus candidus]|uniref:Amine oxidase n=1 Tax=Aspergillus candidus TaxID=41067 RepID=A0A2I2F3M3_ASPCN|nr:copper amine oxidase [Aspergillus candidus]PLB35229.1 copper amine oxidase [Aspergillus candidus]